MDDHDGDWVEYRRLVLAEIKRLHENSEKTRQDIVSLKVEAAKWGAVSGLIMSVPGILVAIWQLFKAS